jgi:predicted AAA+ superfamily ATPase
MIERLLKNNLSKQLETSKKSILLLGARQTGKSTLIKELSPTLTINLARETTYREHLVDPKLIERQVAALPTNTHCKIFVDEIQRLPSMLNTIQAIVDDNKHIIFFLTGSSARKLKRGAANLLPGRILQHKLFPLVYWEINKQFNLEKALQIGTLPEIYLETYGPDLLKDYIDIYLREEIIAESILRNHATYGIFLELAARFSGQEINYSKLASDSEIPKESIRRYVEILDDTLLIQRIPGFTATNSSRKAIQREKIIFFDLGVRNGILGIHKNKLTSKEYGCLFEQWVIYPSHYEIPCS